ncbi:MAG: glycosyltransferase family 9 protein [Candidatus Riflebacteria bacterium]|nr:glycosyltransferase family 9 protein [Candidatus Riflebacteria bacterium]
MKPDTMRKIDATLGPPICAMLTLRRKILDKIWPRRFGALAGTPIKKILMVKPAEMGSTVLMYAMLRRAREIWPECEFHFLVFAENTAAVEMLGLVPKENIHTIKTSNLLTFTYEALQRLISLNFAKFDLVFDLEFFSRASAILAELTGARSSCGFNRFTMEGLYKGNFFTHPVQYNAHIHTAQTFLAMIDAVIQPTGQIPLSKSPVKQLEDLELARLSTSTEEQQQLKNLLYCEAPDCPRENRLVIINANSSELVPLRRWPLENFIELGRRLLERTNISIVLTGTSGERPESERVSTALGSNRVINMVGKTSLRQLLVLYSVCDLMITNDSGPSHFASLTDLPVITLFGPETPKLYGALGKNKVAISAGLACSPCVSSYNHRVTSCNSNVCMRSIHVDDVYSTCQKLLQP